MATSKLSEEKKVVPLTASEVDVCVGIDDGRFGIKIVTSDGEWLIPSRVSSGANAMSLSEGGDDTMYLIPGTNERYTVSDQVSSIDMRFPDYQVSPVNRVLINHALIKAGLGGRNVRIVAGLPISDFFLANKENEQLIKRKTESIRDNPVTNMNTDVSCANIVQVAVVSEAIAAFFDLRFDKDGKKDLAFESVINAGPIAIVDIGGETTDIAVIENSGRRVDSARSGSPRVGALSLNDAVEQRLKEKFKIDQINPIQVCKAVESGELRLFGKSNDCSDIIAEEKKKLAEQIASEVHRRIRDGADLEKIYFVGGGSLLLLNELKSLYPHSEFVANPQFSNARGMLKIAQSHWAS